MVGTRTVKLFIAYLGISLVLPAYAIEIDGITYSEANRLEEGSTKLIEYLPPDQTLHNWNAMVTIQCHSGANSIADVVVPYYEIRQPMIAAEPEMFEMGSDLPEDVLLLMLLGSPEIGRVEYSISRFLREDVGVISLVYSYSLPVQDEMDVTEVMDKRGGWINDLASFSYSELNSKCAGE